MRPLRDPAPSRFAYRMNRLMLTPAFRGFLRYGLPVLIVATGVTFWLSDAGRRADLTASIADFRRQIEERPEFMVRMMLVENASEAVVEDVRQAVPLDFPISSFDLDLEAIRAQIEKLDPVAGASVRIRSGGVLLVTVEERLPVAVWRSGDGLELIDATGHRVASLDDRETRGDLPLIVGAGADRAVPEALALIDMVEPFRGRFRGLQRMGERRWDVVLDRDQRILLPEANAAAVLSKVVALDRAQDLLARDISVIDFRNPRRPVLRLNPNAVQSLADTRATLNEDKYR